MLPSNEQKRQQLQLKLSALIAVLRVAITKIEASQAAMQNQEAAERLEKIHKNLDHTLLICERAMHVIDPDSLFDKLSSVC